MARKTRTPRQGSTRGAPQSGQAPNEDMKPTEHETDTSTGTETETGTAKPPEDVTGRATVDAAGQDTGGAKEGEADTPADAAPPGAGGAAAAEARSDETAQGAADSATDATAATPEPDPGAPALQAGSEPATDAKAETDEASAEVAKASSADSGTVSSDTAVPETTTAADSHGPDAETRTGDRPDDDTLTAEERGAAAAAAAVPAAAGMAAAGMAAAGAATSSATERPSGSGAAARAPAAPPPPPRRSAVPLFLGGVAAAGLGLGAGWYAAEQGWIGGTPELDLSAQDARIAALSGDVDALQSRLADLAEAPRITPDDLAQVQSDVQETLDSGFADMAARIETETQGLAEARAEAEEIAQAMGSLLQRLERAEAALAELDGIDAALADQGSALDEALSALSVRVASIQGAQDGLREEIAAVRAIAEERIEDIQTAAAEAAAEADRRAALAEARAALDTIAAALQSGAPFAPALARVETATDAIGQPLRDAADSGVATLGALQEDFGPAARAGLGAALQGMEGDSAYDRLGSFLRSQIGARSLQPREGDDPDAVMSRATQAVNDGDIAAALDELDALPPAGQAAMSGWLNAARARMDALSAFDALAADMTDE